MSWLNVLWLVLFLGKVETRQQAVLDFLLGLIRVQRETIRSLNKGRDKRLNDQQRRRLAILARAVPHDFLQDIAALSYSPDTFLRWYKKRVHQKYNADSMRRGRPATAPETVALVRRLAEENPSWGYRRIVGVLKQVGVSLSKNTVARILEDGGLNPAPKRARSWRDFLEQHWSSMIAADFFTVELTRGWGIQRVHVLVMMHLATRRIHIAGIVDEPTQAWLVQIARNETDENHGFLKEGSYLIHDRAAVFSQKLKQTLAASGVTTVKLPARSPNLNAHVERVIRSIREECLDRFVIFSREQLEYLLREYVTHYREERPHQGLGNRLISGHRAKSGDEPGWAACSAFIIAFLVRNYVDLNQNPRLKCVQISPLHQKQPTLRQNLCHF
ncbi:integrase core domain-containing protein [Acanthopleuribacter pedis]|uniref:Transposase n=1 Tax=Acanthopleuribacter pedis TaxID=442870 RepID=A0A8J7U7V6_9BACT|nr:integrase core domain-containing protein [Acanthopleuribacter pedis]MBO1321801.1 transposase [Acanthopleuribacter pedis]